MVGGVVRQKRGVAGVREAKEGKRSLVGKPPGTGQMARGAGGGQAGAAEFCRSRGGSYAEDLVWNWDSCGWLGGGGVRECVWLGPGGVRGGAYGGGGAALPGRGARGRWCVSVRGGARARAREEAPELVGPRGTARSPRPYVRETGSQRCAGEGEACARAGGCCSRPRKRRTAAAKRRAGGSRWRARAEGMQRTVCVWL